MVYYCGLLIYILVLYLATGQIKKKEKGRKIFFLLTCLGVVLFQGYRSFTVGTDLVSYISAYPKIGESNFFNLAYLNFEPGYVLLNKVLYRFGFDERGFLIVVSAMVQIPIFYTMYRYSEKPLLSVLWYFAFGNFLMTFSGLRQAIAMAICFVSYVFIKNKQILYFISMILFASTFHTSALFCLILYPAYFVKLDKRKIFIAIGMLVLLFLFRNSIFSFFSALYYGEARTTSSTGAYTMFVVFVFLFLLSFYNRKENIDYIGLRNILLLLAMIYSFASMHDYVTRVGYPLTLYMTIYIPKLVNSFNVIPRKIYYSFVEISVIIIFFYFLGGLDTLPFSFM